MMAMAAGSVSGPCDAAGNSSGQGSHPKPPQSNTDHGEATHLEEAAVAPDDLCRHR